MWHLNADATLVATINGATPTDPPKVAFATADGGLCVVPFPGDAGAPIQLALPIRNPNKKRSMVALMASTDGNTLVFVGGQGGREVWVYDTRNWGAQPRRVTQEATAAAVNSTGNVIVTCQGHELHEWTRQEGGAWAGRKCYALSPSAASAAKPPVPLLQFSPDDQYLACYGVLGPDILLLRTQNPFAFDARHPVARAALPDSMKQAGARVTSLAFTGHGNRARLGATAGSHLLAWHIAAIAGGARAGAGRDVPQVLVPRCAQNASHGWGTRFAPSGLVGVGDNLFAYRWSSKLHVTVGYPETDVRQACGPETRFSGAPPAAARHPTLGDALACGSRDAKSHRAMLTLITVRCNSARRPGGSASHSPCLNACVLSCACLSGAHTGTRSACPARR